MTGAGFSFGIWKGDDPLILGSGSRTRRDLIMSAGIPVEMVRPDVDERALEARARHLPPVELAVMLAAAKAQQVVDRLPGRMVLGADQVLECDGLLLHKPADESEAREQIGLLQGRSHALHSAVALVHAGGCETLHASARLTMRSLDAEAIATYVRLAGRDSVTSSVGGYQLEHLGIHLFERIEGDQSTILGLPLLPVLALMRRLRLLAF